MRKVFLDTNVVAYAFLSDEPRRKERAKEVIEEAVASGRGCVSYQVIQEFANLARRKFATRFSAADCALFIDTVLAPMCQVESSRPLMQEALRLNAETGYAVYDSLIIAAARQADCDVLYSEDMQHNQLIGSLRIVNPFAQSLHEPENLSSRA